VVLLAGLGGLAERRRRNELLRRGRTIAGVQGMRWSDFEDLLVELFRKEGYAVEKTARGADGGVDHVLRRGGEMTIVQAKQWNRARVPLEAVQRTVVVSAVGGAARAMVVTSGGFTPAAVDFARESRSPKLELVDGDALLVRLRAQGLADRLTSPHPVPEAPLPGVAISRLRSVAPTWC